MSPDRTCRKGHDGVQRSNETDRFKGEATIAKDDSSEGEIRRLHQTDDKVEVRGAPHLWAHQHEGHPLTLAGHPPPLVLGALVRARGPD